MALQTETLCGDGFHISEYSLPTDLNQIAVLEFFCVNSIAMSFAEFHEDRSLPKLRHVNGIAQPQACPSDLPPLFA